MRGPGRPAKEKTTVMYVRLPDKVEKAVREKAKRERRDLSGTVAMMLESQLQSEARA